MLNPRALFRPDVEEFVRESLQLIFLQCLDKNYSGLNTLLDCGLIRVGVGTGRAQCMKNLKILI